MRDCVLVSCLGLLLLSPGATSAEAPGFAASVLRAPALQAAAQRTEAAAARMDAAGRFPDPTVEGMYGRAQMAMPAEERPMWGLRFQQPLPRKGERAADRERARAVRTMSDAEYLMAAGEIAGEIAMGLAEAEAAGQRAVLLEQQIARTRSVLAAVDARLGTGQGSLAGRLVLQSRISSMEVMLERERQMRNDAEAEVRGRLGLPPEAALPLYSAPHASDIRVDSAASVLVAQARAAEATAMARMARASSRPMTAVGLSFEREEASMGNEDIISVSFMTDIPWRSRRYAKAEERAAEADRSAASLEAEAVRHRLQSALGRVERAERLEATTLRLTSENRERLQAEYDAILRAAGTGGMGGESSILMLIETLEKTTETEIQAIDATAAAQRARAELWRYAPPESFGETIPASAPTATQPAADRP